MKSRYPLLHVLTILATVAFSPVHGATSNSPQNTKLLAALEPLEGLTEQALENSDAKVLKNLKAAEAARITTLGLLAPDAAARFDALFGEARAAQKKKDHVALALAAAELYKVIASALDPAALAIPQEVSLLDYVGFRTKALLKVTPPDWNLLAATAREANGYWAKIRAQVSNKKLQAAMDKAQAGLARAAETKDARLSASATREDLDLVDDLEKFFAK